MLQAFIGSIKAYQVLNSGNIFMTRLRLRNYLRKKYTQRKKN